MLLGRGRAWKASWRRWNFNQLLGDREALGLQRLTKEVFSRERTLREPQQKKTRSLGTGNRSVGLEQKAWRGRHVTDPRQDIVITPHSSLVSLPSQSPPQSYL